LKAHFKSVVLLSLLPAFSLFADDIVVKGQAPKFFSGTPTEEMKKMCRAEKNESDRLQVCAAVVTRYARTPSPKLPADAHVLAQELVNRHLKEPKRPETIFGIDDAYLTLGLHSIKSGDIKQAKDHLLKSDDTPPTPARRNFAPQMQLARELAAKGEADTVRLYLEKTEKIWTAPEAADSLSRWKTELAKSKNPNFKP